MYSRSALSSEYIRPAGSGGSSMLCCSLPCGRREWRVLRHNCTSLICLIKLFDVIVSIAMSTLSCLRITRLRTKWFWSSQKATLLVFKLYLSGKAAYPFGCQHKNWTPESEKPVPALSRPLKLAIAQHSTKAFRERNGFLAQVSQTHWDIY